MEEMYPNERDRHGERGKGRNRQRHRERERERERERHGGSVWESTEIMVPKYSCCDV